MHVLADKYTPLLFTAIFRCKKRSQKWGGYRFSVSPNGLWCFVLFDCSWVSVYANNRKNVFFMIAVKNACQKHCFSDAIFIAALRFLQQPFGLHSFLDFVKPLLIPVRHVRSE